MDTSGAKGALTGDRYRESLNDGREVWTHALGDPQIDRSASAIDDPDLALRVVEERADGVASAVPSSWPRSRRCRTRFWCTSAASPPSATPSSS